MTIEAFLDAIADELRGDLPGLKTCRVHDGRWDEPEIGRWSVASPAVMVACLGVVKAETPGVRWTDAHLQLAAVVMTTGKGRGKAARALIGWLLLHLPRTRWGLGSGVGLGLPEQVRAANMYSSATDKKSAAIWALMWQQTLRLEAAADGTCPPLPTELYRSEQDGPHERILPEPAA